MFDVVISLLSGKWLSSDGRSALVVLEGDQEKGKGNPIFKRTNTNCGIILVWVGEILAWLEPRLLIGCSFEVFGGNHVWQETASSEYSEALPRGSTCLNWS